MMAGRIRWAVEGLGLTGGERVLEVGPGHGLGIVICSSELDQGLVVGLDRSAKMIAACAARNAESIAAGRVELIEGTPESAVGRLADLAPFDRVLALRVRSFLDDSEKTLMPLVPLLSPGAEVHLVFDSPRGEELEEAAARMERIMMGQGFRSGGIELERNEEFEAVRVVGVAPAIF